MIIVESSVESNYDETNIADGILKQDHVDRSSYCYHCQLISGIMTSTLQLRPNKNVSQDDWVLRKSIKHII